jgi:hypothetical protein
MGLVFCVYEEEGGEINRWLRWAPIVGTKSGKNKFYTLFVI